VRATRPSPARDIASMTRRLVLVGGGQAHLHVLRELARRPIPDSEVVLVSPADHHYYAAMVPGFLQGQYDAEALRFDLAALARCAGARFVRAAADRIDVAERVVVTPDEQIMFDICSLDVGSDVAGAHAVGMKKHAFTLRPMARAVELRARVDALIASATRPLVVAVVGGGASGVELAFAIQRRLCEAPRGGMVTIVERGRELLGDFAPAGRQLATRLLRERGVGLVLGGRATGVSATAVTLDAGATVPADLVVWASGASAPTVLNWSDVPRNEGGYMLVDRTLRAVDGSPVWGAGDCVALQDRPELPKAGVYAVREAPILDRSLRAALGQGRAKKYRPQERFMALLNTGDDKAMLRWRGVHLHGRWAWRLKDRMDRKFVEQHRAPPCDEKNGSAS
jgi:pyridine nucleotide-disulfide oxidoreductase family protein